MEYMNQELQNYINEARAHGASDDGIQAKLREVGWNEEMIQSALRTPGTPSGRGGDVYGDERGFHAFGFTLPYVITGLACIFISLVSPLASAMLELDVFDFDELLVLIYSVVLGVLLVGLLVTTNIALRVTGVSERVFSKSFFVVGVTSLPAMLLLFLEEYYRYSDMGQFMPFISPLLMACVYVFLLKCLTGKSMGHAIGIMVATVFGTALFVFGVYLLAVEML